MSLSKTYKINSWPGGIPTRIPISQADGAGRTVLITFDEYSSIQSNISDVTLTGRYENGQVFTKTITSGNIQYNGICINIDDDYTQYPGTVECTLHFDYTGQVALQKFYLDVEQDAGYEPVEPLVPPAGTITITENGTHNVASYASAQVDVPGIIPEGYITITENNKVTNVYNYRYVYTEIPEGTSDATGDAMRAGTLVDFDMGTAESCPYITYGYDNISPFKGAQFIRSITANSLSQANYMYFMNMPCLERFESSGITSIAGYAFANSGLKELVLPGSRMAALVDTTALEGTPIAQGTGGIFVNDDLVNSYKQNTNWSRYASVIYPISDLT